MPKHRASTAHTASIYPFHADAGFGAHGVFLGSDVLTGGGAFCFDPFAAYSDGLITSPNMLILGEVGSGKSSSVKTFLHRSVGILGSPGGLGRWCAIIDPKGEYGRLGEALGLEVVKLHPGGVTRLNPLDPGIGVASDSTGEEAKMQRRCAMAASICSAVLRRTLTPIEDATLGWAMATLARRPHCTLVDLARLITAPNEAMSARAHREPEELAREVEALSFALGRLLDRDLRGMFDAASTINLDHSARGVVVDLSAVHHDAEVLRLVMIAAAGWLQSYLSTPAGSGAPQRVQVIEEAWAVLGDPLCAKYLQSCYKLSRSYGVANIAVAHRVGDLCAQADDGTSTAKMAMALLSDTQTRVLFRQGPDQTAETASLLGLTEPEAALLPGLPRGRALWKVAGRAALVQHVIGETEREICDTDSGFVSHA